MINCCEPMRTPASALRTTGWCVIINNHTNHFTGTSFIIELIIDGWINYNVDGLWQLDRGSLTDLRQLGVFWEAVCRQLINRNDRIISRRIQGVRLKTFFKIFKVLKCLDSLKVSREKSKFWKSFRISRSLKVSTNLKGN